MNFWGDDFFRRLWRAIGKRICCCCIKRHKNKKSYKGRKLNVEIAPEPSDVFFENVGDSSRAQIYVRISAICITVLSLAASWIAIYGLSLIS